MPRLPCTGRPGSPPGEDCIPRPPIHYQTDLKGLGLLAPPPSRCQGAQPALPRQLLLSSPFWISSAPAPGEVCGHPPASHFPFSQFTHAICRHEVWKRLKSLKCSATLLSKPLTPSCDSVTEYSEAQVPPNFSGSLCDLFLARETTFISQGWRRRDGGGGSQSPGEWDGGHVFR